MDVEVLGQKNDKESEEPATLTTAALGVLPKSRPSPVNRPTQTGSDTESSSVSVTDTVRLPGHYHKAPLMLSWMRSSGRRPAARLFLCAVPLMKCLVETIPSGIKRDPSSKCHRWRRRPSACLLLGALASLNHFYHYYYY